MKKYGTLIQKMREEKGISQNKLSSIIGVTQPTLSHYEAGINEAPYSIVKKTAEELNFIVFFTIIDKENKNVYTTVNDADLLKYMRYKRSRSSRSLGKSIGISKAAILNYEAGRRKIKQKTLIKIAKGLNFDITISVIRRF